jgi:hypothetical protein
LLMHKGRLHPLRSLNEGDISSPHPNIKPRLK